MSLQNYRRRVLSPATQIPAPEPQQPGPVDPRRLSGGLADTYDEGQARQWDQYDQQKAAVANEQIRQGYFQQQEAEAAAKEAEAENKRRTKEANDLKEISMESQGLVTDRNPDGSVVQAKDPLTGKPVVKDIKGPVQYDATGRAYQVERTDGAFQQKFLDADAPIGNNPQDPNDRFIYRQNKAKPWDAIDPEEGLLSPDKKVKDASAAALRDRELQQMNREKARIAAELKSPALSMDATPAKVAQLVKEATERKASNNVMPGDEELLRKHGERQNRLEQISKLELDRMAFEEKPLDEFVKEKLGSRKPEELAALQRKQMEQGSQRIQALKTGLDQERTALEQEQMALMERAQKGYTAAEAPDIIRQQGALRLRMEALNAKAASVNASIEDHQKWAEGLNQEQTQALESVKAEEAAKVEEQAKATGADPALQSSPPVKLTPGFTPKYRQGVLETNRVQDLPTALAQNPGKDIFLRDSEQGAVRSDRGKLLGREQEGGTEVPDVRMERETGYALVAETTRRARELAARVDAKVQEDGGRIAKMVKDGSVTPEQGQKMFKDWAGASVSEFDTIAESVQGDLRRVRDLGFQGAVPINKVVEAYKAAGVEVKPVPDLNTTLDAAGKLDEQSPDKAKARLDALNGYIREHADQPLFNTAAVSRELELATRNLKKEQLRASGSLNVAATEIANGWDQFTGSYLMMRAAMNHLSGDEQEFLDLHQRANARSAKVEARGSVVESFGSIKSKSDAFHYVGQTVLRMIPDLVETAGFGLTGALIGSAAAPGAGTAGGAIAGVFGKTAIKRAIAKEAVELIAKQGLKQEVAMSLAERSVLSALKTEAKAGGKGVLSNLIRQQTSQTLAKWGAFASSFRGNGGEYLNSTLGEMTSAEIAADPDKVDRAIAASLLLAVPAAALDALDGVESGMVQKLLGNTGKELRKKTENAALSFAKELGVGVGKEAGTGLMQGIMGVYAKRITDKVDLDLPLTKEESAEIFENTVGEAIGGGVFTSVGATRTALAPIKEAWQVNQANNKVQDEIKKTAAVVTSPPEQLAELAGVDPAMMTAALGAVPSLDAFGPVPGMTAQRDALGLIAADAKAKGDRVTAREALKGMAVLEKQRREAMLGGIKNLVALEESFAAPIDNNGVILQPGMPEHEAMTSTARAVVAVATGRADTLDNAQLLALDLKRGTSGEIEPLGGKTTAPDGVPRVSVENGELIVSQGTINRVTSMFPAAAPLIGQSETERRASVAEMAAKEKAKSEEKDIPADNPVNSTPESVQDKPATNTTKATQSPTQSPSATATNRQFDVTVDGQEAPVRVTAANKTAAIAQVASEGKGMVRDAVEVSPAPTAKPDFAQAITAAGVARGMASTPERVKRNAVLAKALENEAKRWGAAFPGGFRVKTATNSGGVQISTDRALELDFDGLAISAEATGGNVGEWARLAIQEEVIHSAALELENAKKLDAAAIYNALPPKVQRVIRQAYRTTADPRNLGHEFLRMIIQGRLAMGANGITLDGTIITTEQASPTLAATIRRAINALLAYLKDFRKRLAKAGATPETIAAIDDTVQRIEARLKEFAGTETAATPPTEKTAAVAEPAPEATTEESPVVEPVGTPNPVPRTDSGNPTAITQHSVKLTARFAVRERASLLPSHDYRGNISEGYDQALQPRDRSLPEYQKQSQNIARELSFDQAAYFPDTEVPATTPDLGAPVIDAGAQVIIGNGRFNGIAMAYGEGFPSAGKYKADMVAAAKTFGLDPAVVEAMKEPVLVRVLDPVDKETVIKFSQGSNEGVAMRTNAVELAGQDAQRLSGPAKNVLALLDPNYDLEARQNEPFRQAYVTQVIAAGGANEANLTGPELANRIRMGIFASAYGLNAEGRAALARMAGETDDGAKKITNAMLTMAAGMGWMKAEAAAGKLYDRDISTDLGSAVQRIAVALRDKPAKTPASAVYEGLAGQPDAFEDPMVTRLMQFMVENRSSRQRLEEALSNYVEGVVNLGNPAQADMFGDEPASREALWSRAIDDTVQRIEARLKEFAGTQTETTIVPAAEPDPLSPGYYIYQKKDFVDSPRSYFQVAVSLTNDGKSNPELNKTFSTLKEAIAYGDSFGVRNATPEPRTFVGNRSVLRVSDRPNATIKFRDGAYFWHDGVAPDYVDERRFESIGELRRMLNASFFEGSAGFQNQIQSLPLNIRTEMRDGLQLLDVFTLRSEAKQAGIELKKDSTKEDAITALLNFADNAAAVSKPAARDLTKPEQMTPEEAFAKEFESRWSGKKVPTQAEWLEKNPKPSRMKSEEVSQTEAVNAFAKWVERRRNFLWGNVAKQRQISNSWIDDLPSKEFMKNSGYLKQGDVWVPGRNSKPAKPDDWTDYDYQTALEDINAAKTKEIERSKLYNTYLISIQDALAQKRPVAVAAVEWADLKAIPDGYIKQSELYVYPKTAVVTADGQQDFLAGQPDEPFNLTPESAAERRAREAKELAAENKRKAKEAATEKAAEAATPELPPALTPEEAELKKVLDSIMDGSLQSQPLAPTYALEIPDAAFIPLATAAKNFAKVATTPEALAASLTKMGPAYRGFSEAIWSGMGMSNKDLRSIQPDWNAIYSALDNPPTSPTNQNDLPARPNLEPDRGDVAAGDRSRTTGPDAAPDVLLSLGRDGNTIESPLASPSQEQLDTQQQFARKLAKLIGCLNSKLKTS
jgi:hypothetical protein